MKNKEDTVKVQIDIDRFGSLDRKWIMRFHSVKCNLVEQTKRRSNKFQASYTLEGTVLENVEIIKYLGVTFYT